MSKSKKPPVGLIPEFVFEEDRQYDRITQIIDAMQRYADADEDIPSEWIKELSKRVELYRSSIPPQNNTCVVTL